MIPSAADPHTGRERWDCGCLLGDEHGPECSLATLQEDNAEARALLDDARRVLARLTEWLEQHPNEWPPPGDEDA